MSSEATPSASAFGTAAFEAGAIKAAAWGTYVVRYTVGAQPLSVGATVRVQLPDSWHAWRRNGAKGVQSHVPDADNYVTARVVVGAAKVRCEVEGGEADDVVKSNRVGIDGRAGRYVYVARVTVETGGLRSGDVIAIVYGDRSGGSRGFAAALNPQGPEPVAVAIDVDGSGMHMVLPVSDCPVVDVTANEPFEVLAYAPSVLAVGERAELRIVVVDAEGNRVDAALATPSVSVQDGGARIDGAPQSERPGTFAVAFTPTTEGVLRLRVSIAGLPDLVANPTWVSLEPPPVRVYWGDLHSHADHSFDGVGRFPYQYARDVSGLDFYALTEHCERWEDGDWKHLVEQVDAFHDPGRFVVFLAYEATFHEPWGHHNVYFRDPADAIVLGADQGTVLDLWQALRGRRALTIPHHTGVAFSPKTAGSIPGSTSPAVDWQYHDPQLRRAIEIYSGHGQSEFYDPSFDLSYENSDFSTNTSRDGAHYARDAWEQGHELGVIASSDNHRAQPGRGELGLAAVHSSRLDRSAVFDAIHDRRSYGTTGARMLLDFTIDGAPMGSSVTGTSPPTCHVRVSGTAELDVVEVFGADVEEPGSARCLASWHPQGMDFAESWTDERPASAGRRVYYVRARQRVPFRGRKPTAWSSPIWVDGSQRYL